eukprot:sb/3467575/
MSQHSNSVVVSLQSQLATMTLDFKSVLVSRTESIKEQKQRRDQFSSEPVMSSYPTEGEERSLLLESERSDETALDFSGYESQQMVESQDTYLHEREKNIVQIYSKIEELGQMMTRLSTMISEQGETISLLDTNVTDIQLNVEAAHSELLKYFQNISSNRWLMFKVFEKHQFKLTYEQKNQLAAYYRQCTMGPYHPDKMEVGFLDFVGNDRKKAWEALGEISQNGAKAGFCNLLESACPELVPWIRHKKRERENKIIADKEQKEEEKRKEEEEQREATKLINIVKQAEALIT